eukprot:scaffold90460_cov66-Cyclotella_meneghiniana.AAC.4
MDEIGHGVATKTSILHSDARDVRRASSKVVLRSTNNICSRGTTTSLCNLLGEAVLRCEGWVVCREVKSGCNRGEAEA